MICDNCASTVLESAIVKNGSLVQSNWLCPECKCNIVDKSRLSIKGSSLIVEEPSEGVGC